MDSEKIEILLSNIFSMQKNPKILHLGCGRNKLPKTIGIDIRDFPEVDVRVDLNSDMPFGENSVDGIVSNHVLEHLDYSHIMNESLRILKTGGISIMIVPHYTNHRAHMGEHKIQGFSWIAFEHFADKNHPFYGFEIMKNEILFGNKLNFIGKLINSNKKITYIYERFFSGIFPAVELAVIMKKKFNAEIKLEKCSPKNNMTISKQKSVIK
ncbi:MAG: methyltransferase domain-containing protein [Candidatus Diapherotrites archaeon]